MSLIFPNQEQEDMPPPTPMGEDNKDYENDFLLCNKCSSQVEIISIDNMENKITFKCLNGNLNHGIQTLLINDYLENLEKNNYMDICFICQKKKSKNNGNRFKYCIKCQKYICNECLKKHNNNKIKENEHILLNNKETKIKCLIHSRNEIIEYCLDCKKQIIIFYFKNFFESKIRMAYFH